MDDALLIGRWLTNARCRSVGSLPRGADLYSHRDKRAIDFDAIPAITNISARGESAVIRGLTETISIDGKISTESLDDDGDLDADRIEIDQVSTDAAGVRTESTTVKNLDNTIRSTETTTISANGKDDTERDALAVRASAANDNVINRMENAA